MVDRSFAEIRQIQCSLTKQVAEHHDTEHECMTTLPAVVICQTLPSTISDKWRYNYTHQFYSLLLLLSYALGAITGQPGNGIIVWRV